MDKIPVGIVGGGKVGESFIRDLRKEIDIHVSGIVTSTPQRQQELREKCQVEAYGSIAELMQSRDKPVVVCIVNANDAHHDATLEALKFGAHVYCEKPMAPTLPECEAMVLAAQRANRELQVGFEYRHGTMTARLRELVAQDYFGKLTWASVLDSRGHWWSERPDAPLSKIWKLDRSRGGGIVFHCGIHQLDLIRCYLGAIEELTAYRPPQNALSFYPANVPDNVTLILKASSGAVCNFQIFHNRAPCYYREVPPFHPDWRTVPGHEFSIALIGTKASCQMQIYDERLHLFRFDLERKDTLFERTELFSPHHPSKSHHDMHGLLIRFIRSVAHGGKAIDSATDALETMRLAFAAEDAIASGGTVKLSTYRRDNDR